MNDAPQNLLIAAMRRNSARAAPHTATTHHPLLAQREQDVGSTYSLINQILQYDAPIMLLLDYQNVLIESLLKDRFSSE